MTTDPDPARAWVADPSITWRIALTASLDDRPDPAAVARRLAALHDAQGWPGAGDVVTGPLIADLRTRLGERDDRGVAVGLAGTDLVVSAHHSRVDGDGLLAVLAAVSGLDVHGPRRRTAARAPGAGRARTVADRLGEALLTPAAPLDPARPVGRPGLPDVYVEREHPERLGTGELVVAAVLAAEGHQRAIGGRHRHVSVAVGVGRPAPDDDASTITDRSALVRLRDVERASPDDVRRALRSAPLQPDLPAGGAAGAARWGLRLLGSRLGSTLLVSHLGRVTAPGVRALAFHPVTAGGSGVSLGAVTLDGVRPTTRLTLRARGAGPRGWTHDGLEQLLQAVVRHL